MLSTSERSRCGRTAPQRLIHAHGPHVATPSDRVQGEVSPCPVLEVAADAGVPVVIATGLFAKSEPLQVAEVAATSPSVPVVMTSGGQINISGLAMVDAWQALTSTPNLHVLTNGEYRQDYIERLATELDPARVLFASFAPVFDPRFEVARIRSARLSDAARRAVEHDNAVRLFGLAADLEEETR